MVVNPDLETRPTIVMWKPDWLWVVGMVFARPSQRCSSRSVSESNNAQEIDIGQSHKRVHGFVHGGSLGL